MRLALVSFSFVALVFAVSACGGSTQNDLYGGKSGSGGGGYGQGGGTSGGSGGAATGGAGGTSAGGSAGSVATGGSDTGGAAGMPAGGTGGMPSGGMGGMPSGGTGGMPSGGTGGVNTGGTGGVTTDQVVHCGGSACKVPSDYCCQYVTSGGYSPTCETVGQSCNQGSEVYCDGPEDCSGGDVCCGQLVQVNNQNLYNIVQCMPASQCSYQQGYRVFCNGNQGVCPNGTTCQYSGILKEYQVCAGN